MTQKQIDKLRKTLPSYQNWESATTEQKILDKELEIREMMLSNLAYHEDYFEMVKKDWYVRNRGSRGYDWEQLERLGVKDGRKRVEELWEEMKEDFAKYATVHYSSYVDPDGLSYNSVCWEDAE